MPPLMIVAFWTCPKDASYQKNGKELAAYSSVLWCEDIHIYIAKSYISEIIS